LEFSPKIKLKGQNCSAGLAVTERAKAVLAAVAACGWRCGVLCFCKVEWLWFGMLRERFAEKVTDYNQKRRGK
jgi:hypothetical protein